MGIIDELSSLIRKGPELAAQVDNFKMNTKSVARGAKDSTFQFPCIITNTVKGEDANTIARTLDKVYATFTQTWLSMNSMFDITLDPTPISYLKRIHQNVNFESVEDNEEDDIYGPKLFMDKEKTFGLLFIPTNKDKGYLAESSRELSKEFLSDYNLSPLEVFHEAERDGTSFQDFANAALKNLDSRNISKKKDELIKATSKSLAPKLTERELKKSNDLMPYGVEIRLIAVNGKKEFVNYVDVVIGVKTILHLVSSEEMVDNIARIMVNQDPLFKFLRWTTGEISFFKDLILNLGTIRSNASATGRGNTPFFGTLQRLKNKKIAMNNFTSPRFILPNSTFVLTTYEVDVLRDKFGIDLRDEMTTKKFLQKMFLIGFMILDEGNGSLRVMYDGDSRFQYYTLDVLERENLANQNRLNKEIGRMLVK